MANETRAHIALVTGDLITTRRDPLDDCLDSLARLRADAGVFGCMGNHEIYAAPRITWSAKARAGVCDSCATRAAPLRFGNAVLNLAGVDYQRSPPALPGGRGKAGRSRRLQRAALA